MKTSKKSLIIRLLVILAGFIILLYPVISDYVNTQNSGNAVNSYAGSVKKTTKKQRQQLFKKARAYNQALAKDPETFYHPNLVPGYASQLKVADTDVMAIVDIPKIKVHLPVYHGTANSVLGDGIGHLKGTSLPIGGKSTHSVLVGHRGLLSATLFTDLDAMKKGDYFTVTTLDKKITYKVDAIHVVKPNNVKYLQIEKGKDYCTLLTCTPYGINTERLLVRGVRVKNLPEDKKGKSGFFISPKKLIYYGTMALLGLLVVIWLIALIRRSRKEKPAE